tara:strand:- start:178 stop:612 length:435 start_codon:yes stop_codon:yes gene_type:complete
MEDYITLSIFLPMFPLGMTILIFILLRSFNRTINRLTKPVSVLMLGSILISTLLSIYFFFNHVSGNIPLPSILSIFKSFNLQIHLNELREKIIIILGLISSSVILYSVIKLPRRSGYVLYMVSIGFITSLLISGTLLIDINVFN